MKKIVYISDLTKKLKLLRHKYDLTQDDVANALEIHRSTYAYYEIGRTIPSIGILKSFKSSLSGSNRFLFRYKL